MNLKLLGEAFSICKVEELPLFCERMPFYFLSKTDEELSLVCTTEFAPKEYLEREDGWRGFRVEGVLDFSMIGVLAAISAILAEERIGIFVISTFNTDYVLMKAENIEKAVKALKQRGYCFV